MSTPSAPSEQARRDRPGRRGRGSRRGWSPERIERRRATVPAIAYPPDLPVSERVDDLSAAIAAHQVVIVAGETGSGKSTQLPKICLALGRGVTGMIGHTQPRRIAARALAERIAEETGTELGAAIGYSIRFGDHTGPDTLVKLMTDGILLAEIHRDPDLLAYDTLIVDEAHERSLNIDFLLGYVRQLLPRRPDLKVIITSATIDPQKFSAYFADAPIVEVSGRTYPVDIRYRPFGVPQSPTDDPDEEADLAGDRGEIDQPQAICRAVDELIDTGPGDILVFLSGEREITDTAEVLRGHLAGRRAAPEILPLFGRLSAADQHRVFAAHSGRRVVLSTNVAETSLTVPGVHYVIDPGTARISRYSTRTKVQRLPIEPISQASAGQRAGRCGRVAAGVAIRLYSQADFENRPRYTDPEILRTSLASVILQMAALRLGDIRAFPFLDPPDARQIADGLTVLRELGALEGGADVRLTKVGRSIAALPLDPRLARIVLEGAERHCLDEMLVLAAGLAIQDVREYPLEDRDRAVAAHSRFVDPSSDFLALLHLWRYLRQEGKSRSGNAFRRMCRAEYLHYLRIREWQDLHAQLRQVVRGLGLTVEATGTEGPEEEPKVGRGSLATHPFDGQTIHTALLTGFLSHIGLRSEATREFQGTRGSSFVLWPGSSLARRPPSLVMAAELVETSRLFGRIAAAVQPEWVEAVGGELLRRNYSEPRWSKRRAQVVATEKVTLLGVTLVAARTVAFDHIDPELARELFVRHALVEGDWETRHAFLAANQRAADEVRELEDRARRRDLLVDDETLFALYDARIPADITSGRRFDAWWRKASRTDPTLLTFTPQMLTAAADAGLDPAQFPDALLAGGTELPLDYVFDPGRADDGVTVTVPLAVLAGLQPEAVPDQIPGHQRDLAIALLRTLPKTLRRLFVPVPDTVDRVLAGVSGPPTPRDLAAGLTRLAGIPVQETDFDPDKVPAHLRLRFRVVDAEGAEVATGLDLDALRGRLRTQTREAVAAVAGAELRRAGLTAFPVSGLPRRVEADAGGQTVVGYPALVDEGGTVGIDVFTDPVEQAAAMRAGTRRLLVRAVPVPTQHVRNGLTRSDQLVLASTPYGSIGELLADATGAAVDALLDWAGGPAWEPDAFAALEQRLKPQVPRAVLDIARATIGVLTTAHRVEQAIAEVAALPAASAWRPQLADLRARLAELLPPGFLTSTGAAHLPDLTRWLQALAVRAQRLRENADRDRTRMVEVNALARELDDTVAALPPGRAASADVAAVRRLLAEFRVATFAQPLRTAVPVSHKKVTAAIVSLRA